MLVSVTDGLVTLTLVLFCFCFFCFFFCMVMDFSAVEKDRGEKFCVHVRLLSRQVSHFDELWLTVSHGGGITSDM